MERESGMLDALLGVLRLTGTPEDERFLGQSPYTKRQAFLLTLIGWIYIVVLAAFTIANWASPGRRVYLLGLLLLFSLLLWRMPRATARQMHSYLMAQTLITTLAYHDSLFILIFCFLAFQAAMSLSFRSSVVWFTLFAVITLSGNTYRVLAGTHEFRILFGSTAFILFVIISNLVARIRQSQIESEGMLTELRAAYDRLEEYAEQDEYLAVAEERNRLSQKLHDTIGHRLTTSIAQLEGASRLMQRDGAQANRMLENARAQLTDGLNELRRTLRALHDPKKKDDILTRFLQRAVDQFSAETGIALHVRLPDALPPLSEAQTILIYQAVQEALTETRSSAQQAESPVSLALATTAEDVLELSVSRRDRSDADAATVLGQGMEALQERAAALDGVLEVAKAPATGEWKMLLNLPITSNVMQS